MLRKNICLLVLIVICSCQNKKTIKNVESTNIHFAKVFNDSMLVYIDYNKQLKIENTEDQRILYSTNLKSDYTFQPILDKKNTLYFANSDDELTCFDVNTKTINWVFTVDNKIQNLMLTNTGILLFSVRGKGLYALDAISGKEIYVLKDDTTGCLNSSKSWNYRFLYDENYLFIADFNCYPLSQYNLRTGELITTYFTTEKEKENRLSIIEQFNGTLVYSYIGSSEIIFIDKDKGIEQNRQDIPITLTFSSISSNNKIYIVSDSTIYEINEDFKFRSIYQLSDTCSVNLNILDDNIYFVDCDYNLIKINLKTYKNKKIVKAPTRNLVCLLRKRDTINYIF